MRKHIILDLMPYHDSRCLSLKTVKLLVVAGYRPRMVNPSNEGELYVIPTSGSNYCRAPRPVGSYRLPASCEHLQRLWAECHSVWRTAMIRRYSHDDSDWLMTTPKPHRHGCHHSHFVVFSLPQFIASDHMNYANRKGNSTFAHLN